jgi:hypothetical protein
MIRRCCLMLLAGAALIGDAQALVGALSPLPDQSTADAPSRPGIAAPAAAPTSPEPGERALPANPLWAIPLKQLESTRERPIFSPSRRPPPPVIVGPSPPTVAARAAPKPAEPQRPQLSLVGTVIGERESIAVFIDETTKNAVRLRTGEDHNGWTLRSVEGREATLERDGESATLALPPPGAEQTAALPAPVHPPVSVHPRGHGR